MRCSHLSLLALSGMTKAAPNPAPQWIPPSYDITEAFPVDDGNPQQVYFYKQISINQQCGDSDGTVECSVGQEQSKSYGVSWGADVSGAGWISAGFSVSEEVSTGSSNECTNKPGDDDEELHQWICMWKRVGHTEYTVQDWSRPNTGDDDDWEESSEPYQMWSPNSDEMGHDYVCAWDDDCEDQGAEWWGPSRTPGEPQSYPFDDKWQ